MPSSACDWSSDVCSSDRSEEHTSELQSRSDLVCRLLLEKKKKRHAVEEVGQPATAAHRAPPREPAAREQLLAKAQDVDADGHRRHRALPRPGASRLP